MGYMKEDYCKESADRLLNKFEDLTGFDSLSLSRTPHNASLRALSYKILIDLNYMNDRQVSEYFESKGITRQRSSIYHALRKMDSYYLNYPKFRDTYDVYFEDRAEESKARNEERDKKFNDIEKKVIRNSPNALPDLLKTLVNSIPDERRQEVYEMLSLRVKSWDWKSKDKCEVIEGDNGVGNNTWNQ